jgi:hypothetical protein
MEIDPHPRKPNMRKVKIEDAGEQLFIEYHLADSSHFRDIVTQAVLNFRRPRYPMTINMTIGQLGRLAEHFLSDPREPGYQVEYDQDLGFVGARNAVIDAVVEELAR